MHHFQCKVGDGQTCHNFVRGIRIISVKIRINHICLKHSGERMSCVDDKTFVSPHKAVMCLKYISCQKRYVPCGMYGTIRI